MFGFLKHLLRKPEEPAPEQQTLRSERVSHSPTTHAPPSEAPRPNSGHANPKRVELPLQKILDSLPLELQPRVRQAQVGELTISVPLEKVLAQLSRGAVRVSFGELRQAAPEIFSVENDRDRVQVSLPLNEILARLNPALITRRRVQRHIEIPDEISSPFDAHVQGAGLAISSPPSGPESPVLHTPPRHTTFTPAPAVVTSRSPAAPIDDVPAPLTFSPAPRQNTPAPSAPPAPPAAIPFKPFSAPTPVLGSQSPLAPRPTQPSFQSPISPPAHLSPAAHVPPVTHIPPAAPAFTQVRSPVPAHAPATAPAPAPAPTAIPAPQRPAAGSQPLLVPLTALAESWPEPIRKEIVTLNLVDAKVALPADAVEQALKLGRIAFSWKTIRSWLKNLPSPVPSPHDATVLELPLKVVAPLFLARQRENAKTKQRVTVDEDIPNLFFGFPQTEPPSPAAPAPAQPPKQHLADTNYYVFGETHDTAFIQDSEAKRGPTPGTKFVAKYATPNEVVSRAASLDGVAGALIALPDGLMVANRLPADLNGDTLAAFLPQIFGKVSQCTKELRMGDLNNLNFTVGNVPWKIFRVNAIFFAAFGRAGEPLPTAQLAALAAELDHKPK